MAGMKRNLKEILKIAQLTQTQKESYKLELLPVDCYKYMMEMTTGGVIVTDAIKFVQGQEGY